MNFRTPYGATDRERVIFSGEVHNNRGCVQDPDDSLRIKVHTRGKLKAKSSWYLYVGPHCPSRRWLKVSKVTFEPSMTSLDETYSL
jgi:hypothetical protein